MPKASPNVARGLMVSSRTHVAAVIARLGQLGYENFPFTSASVLWLMDEGGTRSTLLAQRAGVTKQAMSQSIRMMEQQGYLEQVPDPTDTRAKIVRMTRRGEAVKNACVEVREELNRKLAQALGAKQAALLEANLDYAAEVFGKVAGIVPQ